jgi:uncharacterized membrane protein required for colicin V production
VTVPCEASAPHFPPLPPEAFHLDPTPAQPSVLESIGWIDWTAIVVLLVFLGLGLARGLVWQISRATTLIAGFAAAALFGERLGDAVRGWFAEDIAPEVPLYVAHFTIFLTVLAVVSLCAWFVQRLSQERELSFRNRLLGGLLGFATGALVVVALLTGTQMLNGAFGAAGSVAAAAKDSRSQTWVREALRGCTQLVPAADAWRELLEHPRAEPSATPVAPEAGPSAQQSSVRDR